MSDFDKEAEREKLREKYERDKAERQATQRMSDLLLKGATMTNSHCGTCGDPLFQQEGTTFCPSCHGNPDAVQGTELEAQPAEDAASETAVARDDTADQGTATRTQTQPDRDESTGDGSAADTAAAATDDRSESAGQTEQPRSEERIESELETAAESSFDNSTGSDSPADRTARTHDDTSRPDQSRSSAETPTPSRRSASSSGAPNGDIETAHASLVAALEKFAAEAAETDDPRYAKACLEAAREASETLEVLR